MDQYRSIVLKCGVCGNTAFEYDNEIFTSIEEANQVKCAVCNKLYTQEELREVNSTLIINTTEEMAEEMLTRELKKLRFNIKG